MTRLTDPDSAVSRFRCCRLREAGKENEMIHADDAYSGPGNERLPWAQPGTASDPDETAGTWIADAGNDGAGYDPDPDVIKQPMPGAVTASGQLDPDSVNAKRFVPPGFRCGEWTS